MPLRIANLANEISVSNTKMYKANSDEDFKKQENIILSKPTVSRAKKGNTLILNPIILFLLGTLTSLIIVQLVPNKNLESLSHLESAIQEKHAILSESIASNNVTIELSKILRPTFTMYAKKEKGKQENLSVIRKILRLLGYTEVGIDDDWNLMWGFGTPFPAEKERIMKLKPHQIVGHMPGMNFIVHKAELSTSGSPHMPPAFRLPKEKNEFLDYVAKNPNKIFVEKGNGHRNVAIKKPEDIDLNSTTTFVQEFLTNPYLVDGYKFDIGIYTVITSIDPVRIYIYTGDVMFRYCQEKFHPFDPNVLKKYVVGDNYRPTWKVPSLKKYFNVFGGGMRASFDAYVRDQGEDPTKIWEQAEEVIRYTVVSNAEKIKAKWKPYPVQNFYELIRVDMIVDTNFKVHLIEANLSPNMHSKKFKHNHVVFEQVIYNAMQLVGVGSPIKQQDILANFGERITAVTADKSVASNLNECVRNDCHRECDDESDCGLCISCMDDDEYNILAKAQSEHLHRADMRRIFPKPILNVENFDLEIEYKNVTGRNKWMIKWFYHKCLHDRSWCQ